MEITIQFLDFDLPPNNETDMNYVKITTSGYVYTFYCNHLESRFPVRALPFSLILSDQLIRIQLKTGLNKDGNCGVLLKYRTSGYPKISTVLTQKAKTAILNAKGMYV